MIVVEIANVAAPLGSDHFSNHFTIFSAFFADQFVFSANISVTRVRVVGLMYSLVLANSMSLLN